MSGWCRRPPTRWRRRARRSAIANGNSAVGRSSCRTVTAFLATNMPRGAANSASSNSDRARTLTNRASRFGGLFGMPRTRERRADLDLARQVSGDNDGIELSERAFRQPTPHLVAPEQSDTEIAAHGQHLAVGTYRHHRAVDIAVPRIEDIAALVNQTVTPHVPDERKPQQRRILAIVPAARTNRIF